MDNRVQAISLKTNSFWIMVAGDKDLEIQLDVERTTGIEPRIHMSVMKVD